MFITSKDVTERDIKGDVNKVRQFLKDIGYKQRGDTKSNKSKLRRNDDPIRLKRARIQIHRSRYPDRIREVEENATRKNCG